MYGRTLLACALLAAWSPAGAASLDLLLDALEGTEGTAPQRLERAVGGPLPIDCLSPVLLRAVQAGREPAVAAWLDPPSLPDARAWSGPAGLRVHYTTQPGSPHAVAPGEGDGPETPRPVERVGEALGAAIDLLDRLGFRVSERHPWIDVYLAEVGPGVAGFVAPGAIPSSSTAEDRTGFLVLSNRLAAPEAAAAHQLAHLALLGYSSREPAWWHEATAAWVGLQAAGGAGADAPALAARLAHPEDGLATEDLARMRGDLLLPAFLSLGEHPPSSVRAVWEECAALSGDNLLEALDRVARSTGRGSLADLMRAFYASWVADTAGRSRLRAALGTPLPEPAPAADVTSYPAAGTPARSPVAALGASFLRFTSPPRPGGLDLAVEASPEAAWDALLLVRSSPAAPYAPVPLAVDEAGRASIRYPWAEVSDAVLLLLSLPGDGEPFAPAYAARHRPTIPFDLLEFAAEAAPDAVSLRWTTDSETDLFGWYVYRGRRPDGPFQRLHAVPIPAAGAEGTPAAYRFLDSGATGGKFYYHLEAVTIDGFTAVTHRVGARPLPG